MRPPVGLTLLTAFFMFGALMAFLAFLGLLFPGRFLESMWRANPQAHVALTKLGGWGVLLMLLVAIACALGAFGLWRRAEWGHRLAVSILALNLIADLGNAVVRGDLRTLVGVPIGGAMIFYLLRPRTRAQFKVRSAAV